MTFINLHIHPLVIFILVISQLDLHHSCCFWYSHYCITLLWRLSLTESFYQCVMLFCSVSCISILILWFCTCQRVPFFTSLFMETIIPSSYVWLYLLMRKRSEIEKFDLNRIEAPARTYPVIGYNPLWSCLHGLSTYLPHMLIFHTRYIVLTNNACRRQCLTCQYKLVLDS